MRMLSSLAVLCAAATLAACAAHATTRVPDPEDCSAPGDEDDNGLADCNDPACAGTAACQVQVPPGCGNGTLEASEVCDDGNAIDGDGCDSNCTVTACGNGIQTAGEACDDGNTTSWDGCDASCTRSVLAYVKASNTDTGDAAGFAVALSADGSTLAVAAELEGSAAKGVGGDQADNTAGAAGAVYLFVRSGATWSQQAYVKASNTDARDHFGASLALSNDGSTLAVGAFGEDSAATRIDGDPLDNTAPSAGAVYVYTRSGTTWSQEAYVKPSNAGEGDDFGMSVALSGDGATLAVGASSEASAARGIDGDKADNAAPGAGAVYVFTRADTTWSEQAYVKASNTDKADAFGTKVALSADGLTLAVGAIGEASAATGTAGDPDNNFAAGAGAVYVFTRGDTTWTQQSYVKASSTAAGDHFGDSLALAADGATLAVGADGAAGSAGAAYLFTRVDAAWSEQARITASNSMAGDHFGWSVTLAADGSTLAVGAPLEASAATGLDGNQADNTAQAAGAAYLFIRSNATWNQQGYVKAPNTGAGDLFGSSVALSGDGVTLAVGAPFEDSGATGINGTQADDSGEDGAVYVFR